MDSLLTVYRDWLRYKMSDDRNILNKAYQVAFTTLKHNKSDLHMYFCCVFLNIEKGEFDRADELLDNLTSNKNYFKNNQAQSYVYYLYLNSLIEIRRKKHRSGKKYLRLLEEYSVGREGYIYDLLLASLKLESYEYESAFEFLRNAYLRGCRTPFIFICLHDYYTNELNVRANVNKVFVPYLKWAIAHDLNLEKTLEIYSEFIINLSLNDSDICEKLVEKYPESWLLNEICNSLIKENDFSEKAFHLYNEAISKQIFTDVINDSYIKAAYKNGFEEVSRYSVLKFLERPMNSEIKLFVYHLLLINKKLKDLVATLHNDIIQLSLYCLENNLNSRYANSLYKYLVECSETQEIPKAYLSKAEIFLISELFLHDVEVYDDRCKYLWIQEKEKKGMKVYRVENGKTQVKVLSENFSYYCLDESQKNFFDIKITVKKRIGNEDFKLYQHFFNKKLLSPELLIKLSKHYLSLDKIDIESIEVFERVLLESGLSYKFKMSVSAALGNLHYLNNNYKKAFEYYKDIDENCLQDKYVEQMLLAFVENNDYDSAVNLIIKKADCIAEKTLFYAIQQLKDEKYLKPLAHICYNLILKSWYDKTLLNTVLNYYYASQEEWQELSFFLSHMLIEEQELKEKILENAIYMHKYDIGSQKIFADLYKIEPNNEFVRDFAYYNSYEIIVNSIRLEHETIETLEDMAIKTNEHLLYYALSHVYLECNITTLNSENILRKAITFLEQDNFILPVFKLIKDKSLMTSYIEKNQPFIYRTLPNKNVYLYYKVEGETQYKAKKMIYRQFGMYMTTLVHFFNDKISYYFSEQLPTGSIDSKVSSVDNTRLNLQEGFDDPYYMINNALIYEQMFKYDIVEQIITERLKDIAEIKGKIL